MGQEKKEWIVYAIALLSLVTFLQTCGTKGNLYEAEERMAKRLDSIAQLHDQALNDIQNKVLSEEEMVELIETTPAWKTLRIEEISDKEKISINALEEGDK